MRAVLARVEGRVQGVGFRFATLRAANGFGVAGWVRNLPDGSVECWVQGAAADVEQMERFLRSGPRAARVARYRCREVEADPALRTFSVR